MNNNNKKKISKINKNYKYLGKSLFYEPYQS